MQYYQITLESKNEQSLKNYLKFFNKNIKLYNSKIKLINKNKNKNFTTILKSPHVNKKAQEQFGYNIFSKQLLIAFPNNYQLIFFFKKIEQKLFPDIIVKIKTQFNKNLSKNLKKKLFNPDNYKLYLLTKEILSTNTSKKSQILKNNELFFNKIKKFFQIFDMYGEITKK